MPSPAFTPGNGGGRPSKPESNPISTSTQSPYFEYADPTVGDSKNNDKPAITNYRADVETTYGVRLTRDDEADSWDLLRVRKVHAGLEMAAAALGDMALSIGYNWVDATAFRRIIGDIDFILSGTTLGAPVNVVGRKITFYWLPHKDRIAYPIPNLLLHELGHVFNANAGMGSPYRAGSINFD